MIFKGIKKDHRYFDRRDGPLTINKFKNLKAITIFSN